MSPRNVLCFRIQVTGCGIKDSSWPWQFHDKPRKAHFVRHGASILPPLPLPLALAHPPLAGAKRSPVPTARGGTVRGRHLNHVRAAHEFMKQR